MLLCASVLAQSGFARPRQQHRVPLTRCRVARAQVPNRPHLLRRRDPSSRLGSPIPCKPIEAESRSRGESDSRPTAHDPYGCCGSFFRPPRVPRVPRPSARPTPKEGTDPAPAARGPPHHFVPPSLTPRVSLSRRFLFRLATLRVSRGCEMGCAGDARQASVPAATSDRHTQHRLTRHTRGAPRASRRRRRASEPGPLTPSVPREPAVTVEPFPSARADRATSGLCRPSRHAQSFGPRPRGSPRVHESPAAHSGGQAAAGLPVPSRERHSDRVRR